MAHKTNHTSPIWKYFVKKNTNAKLCAKDIAADHGNFSNSLQWHIV